MRILPLLLLALALAACRTTAEPPRPATPTAVRLSDGAGSLLDVYLSKVGPAGGYFYASRDGAIGRYRICPPYCPNKAKMKEEIRQICRRDYGNQECVLVADGDEIVATVGNWKPAAERVRKAADKPWPTTRPAVRLSDRTGIRLNQYLDRVGTGGGYFYTTRDGTVGTFRTCPEGCRDGDGRMEEAKKQARAECDRKAGYDKCLLIADGDSLLATLGNWERRSAAARDASAGIRLSAGSAELLEEYLGKVGMGGGFFFAAADGQVAAYYYCPAMRCQSHIAMRHKAATDCQGHNDGHECVMVADGARLLVELGDWRPR